MINLSPKEQATIQNVLKKQLKDQPYKVVLFGSRAINTAHKYSDVDLALIGQQGIPIALRAALGEAFENSDLPYTVDIVDFAQANSAMKQHITTYGQELSL